MPKSNESYKCKVLFSQNVLKIMISHQVFTSIAAVVLIFQGVSSSPLPKQHDAATVGRSSDDVYISACPDDKPDYDAGLCYKNCAEGYNGVGPVCWKSLFDSYGRGVGTVPITVDNPYVQSGGFPF